MTTSQIIVLVVFIVVYAAMLALPEKRVYVTTAAAVILTVFGFIPFKDALAGIDLNILMMLAGTMGTVALFTESGMPNRLAGLIMQKTPNVMWVAVAMSLFAGVVSAFVDNVATVLMIAPVALAICSKLQISPVAMLICISVSSNLQGAATLVGDTTSIMLGSYAQMDFLDFLFMDGRFGIFWAVELGAIATVPVIMYIFRKERDPIAVSDPQEVEDMFPTWLLVFNVLALIGASFIPNKPYVTNGLICIVCFAIGALRSVVRTKKTDSLKNAFSEIDLQTILLLTTLFVVIACVEHVGIIDLLAQLIANLGGGNLFITYTIIVWGSVIMSAFIDNIPYVATMLPVVRGIASLMGCSPYGLYFGLLVGATLGGNLTPVGASANIAAIGLLRKQGDTVKNRDFLRIGIPFTLAAVITGYLFCWFIWAY